MSMSGAKLESEDGGAESSTVFNLLSFRLWRELIVPLGIVALLYLVALLSMPPQGLTQHDTGAKYLQVRNLRLTPTGLDWSINYPARSLDPDLQFVPFRSRQHTIEGGRIYLQWPIFLGLLTRIPWKLLGFWGLYVVPLLAGLGLLPAAYRLALQVGVSRRAAWLAVPMVGMATPLAVYSLLFFEHTLAAMLVTLSLLAGAAGVAGGRSGRALPACAVLLGVAVYFRSELYVLALVMSLVFAYMSWLDPRWRRPALQWLGAFVLSLVPLWAFYVVNEGTILPLHAVWYFAPSEGAAPGGPALPAVRYIASAGWRAVPDFLFGPRTSPSSPILPAWTEWVGMLGLALCALPALLRLLRRHVSRPRLVAVFSAGLALVLIPSLAALLSTQPYHNLHGFVLAAPFVAAALWPLSDKPPEQPGVRRRTTPAGWLQAVTLLYVGLHALIISVLSGMGTISRHEWGQRYLLPAYPALAVLALLAMQRVWQACEADRSRLRVVPVALGAALAVCGLLFSVRGYVVTADERAQVVAWQSLAQTLPDREPLVTDVWWLPLNLAPDFYSRPLMLAEGDALTEWARKMEAEGVTRFGLMTTDPALFSGAWLHAVPGLRAEGSPQEARGMWLQRYTLTRASHSRSCLAALFPGKNRGGHTDSPSRMPI